MSACNKVKVSVSKEDDFVYINICGMIYETLDSTLGRFPSTLLGNKDSRKKYFVTSKNAYYFDRNRKCFEAILYYYQSGGLLIRPPDIPFSFFEEEISFFGLEEETLLRLRKKEGFSCEEIILPKLQWQRKTWELFEYPDTSVAARIIASLSVLVIMISIMILCAETMFQGRSNHENSPYHQYWFLLELGCIIWFTIEYIIRFVASPNKWDFMISFLNIIDVLAILPYIITKSISYGHSVPFSVLRLARLVRILRIFKLSRHSLGLQILGHTLKASVKELGMLICFLFLGVILFSSAIFFAESGQNDMFASIPDAFWYSLVTMTTLGYGDKVPITLIGKLVGSLCAVSGVLSIALPVPVIVANFELFNKIDRAIDLERKEKRATQRKVDTAAPVTSVENILTEEESQS